MKRFHASLYENTKKEKYYDIPGGTSASTTINRKDFGFAWNQSLETGGVLVGDDINISLEVEMVRFQPK